jgi:uncharacterized glyoxalase superfamily protein PhnB
VANLFRVILPVTDIEKAAAFYTRLLESTGRRVSPGRHYFQCGQTILACFDPQADGDDFTLPANPDHLYFSVANIEQTRALAAAAGATHVTDIKTQPWGERSFYCRDPFGNPICFVDASTVFTG